MVRTPLRQTGAEGETPRFDRLALGGARPFLEDAWWGTTIYVEHERRLGVQKDGRPEGYNICCTKTVAAPIDRFLGALVDSLPSERVIRVREGKDVRATWHTLGTDAPTEVEAMVKETGGKVGITLYRKRIETRDEADGLRKAWQGRLNEIKRELESQPALGAALCVAASVARACQGRAPQGLRALGPAAPQRN